jgi:intraflagellar transport protein 122
MKLVDFGGEQEQEWNLIPLSDTLKCWADLQPRNCDYRLRNGEVLKIFVDNPFPIQLVKIPSAVRFVDMSCDKKRLAVVDEHLNLFVYNTESKDVIYQDTKVTSVAWNSELEDVLAFSKEITCCQSRLEIRTHYPETDWNNSRL